jgi:hypothetical protein
MSLRTPSTTIKKKEKKQQQQKRKGPIPSLAVEVSGKYY